MTSLILDLLSDLKAELAVEAARLGLPLPEYVLRVLEPKQDATRYTPSQAL